MERLHSFAVAVDQDAMRRARLQVEAFARAFGFPEPKVEDVALALSEAMFNALDHGCCPDGAMWVDVRWQPPRRLEIAVEDGGPDPERCEELRKALFADPPDLPDVEQERGRGLFLIRARSDEVKVELGARGVRVVLVKWR